MLKDRRGKELFKLYAVVILSYEKVFMFRISLFLADLFDFLDFEKLSRQKGKRRNMDGTLILYSQRITYSLKALLMSYCISHHLLLISHLILRKQENCCRRYNLKSRKSKYLSDREIQRY